MPKPSELNPDYVRWGNDKKKKKLIRHKLKQLIENEKRWLAHDLEWDKRRQEKIAAHVKKIAELEKQLEQME